MSNQEIGVVWNAGFWYKIKRCKNNRTRFFEDEVGFFMESCFEEKYRQPGIDFNFVQDNHSLSVEAGVVRGLHFQRGDTAQTKLIRVVTGEVLDAVVDLRKGSPTYGQWEVLSFWWKSMLEYSYE